MGAAQRVLLPAALVAGWLAPAAVNASGCMHEIVVPIRFPPGASCWRQVGAGTTFNGQFKAHQRITASAIGQTVNSDGKRTWVTTGPWQITLTGPGGFSAADNGNGQLAAVLPQTGQYSFTIGPCAVWGNQGTIEICAR